MDDRGNFCERTWLLFIINYFILVIVSGQEQSFRERPVDTSVIRGQPALLKCIVDNKGGKLQWTKDGFALGFDRIIPGFSRYSMTGSDALGEYSLQILNTDMSDDAEYQCQVGPAPGHAAMTSVAHLHVHVPPEEFTILQYHQTINSDMPVAAVPWTDPYLNLTCEALRSKPAAQLTWYHGGDEITESFSYTTVLSSDGKTENASSVLSIRPRKEDNGYVYKCVASHPALTTPLESSVRLSVLFPPTEPEITGYREGQILRTGDTVILACIARGGNPLAQVHWYKNDDKIDYSFETGDNRAVNGLAFTASSTDNNAVYRCEVSNVVMTHPISTQVRLTVLFTPATTKITGYQNARAGETIMLTCTSAKSNPAATISWFSRGIPLSGATEQSWPAPDGGFISQSNITVSLTAQENNVRYNCQATNNDLGQTVSDTVILNVYYPPEPPRISGYIEGTSIDADTRTNKRMTCTSVGGNPVASLTWWKEDQEVEAESSVVGNIASSIVTIVPKADDNGARYTCNATNAATDEPLLAFITLSVNFPPSGVKIEPSPHPGRAGQPMTITCRTGSSNPPSVISWKKNGQAIDIGVDGGNEPADYGGWSSINRLEITPTADDDLAEYGCMATSQTLGIAKEDAIKLRVLYAPIFSSEQSSTVVVTEGENLILNFSARANPGLGDYTWYKNGEKLSLHARSVRDLEVPHFTSSDGILNITAVKRVDAGTYTCEASNAEGKGSLLFILNVQYPASITTITTPLMVNAGSNAYMDCVADAIPKVADMITWSRDGYDMTGAKQTYYNGKSQLTIYNVTKDNTGNFTCTASNKIGDPAVNVAELIVKYSPEISKTPQHSKAAAEKGSTGKITCRAEGAPAINFNWARDGEPLSHVENGKHQMEIVKVDSIHYHGVLLVVNVTRQDYGFYDCNAVNELGQDEHKILLDGTSAPDPPYALTLFNTTHNSITITWIPGFDGGLAQTFMVRYKETQSAKGYKYAEAFRPGYTIQGLNLGTEYELTVQGRNNKGASEFQEKGISAKTSVAQVKPINEPVEEVPLVIILSVTIVGVLLLILNVFLIIFFIRRRRRKLEKESSDGSSQVNTIEMYSTSTGGIPYPPSIEDESKSYTTYDKSIDDYPDEFGRPYEDEDDIKKVFLPSLDPYGPPAVGMYPNGTLDSQRSFYLNNCARTYLDDSVVGAPANWPQPESPYKSSTLPRPKHEDDIYADQLRKATKTIGSKPDVQRPAPPPPPVRSSSKGTIEIPQAMPPIPARNYTPPVDMPRYALAPGSIYGTRQLPPSSGNAAGSEMRGALV